MSTPAYTTLNAMTDIITAPGKAYDGIKAHKLGWFAPYLVVTLLAAAMMYYFYQWVDFSWLVDQTILQQPAESRAESAEGIRKFMQPGKTSMFAIVAIILGSLIIYAIQALYLHLANKLTTASEIGFKQWYSFSVWSNFVTLFGSLAAFVLIFMADSHQLSPEALQVTSLNALIFHVGPDSPWYRWASSLSLLQFWVIFLMIIGYSRWTGASRAKSSIIVLLPWVAVFGIWAALI